MIGQHSLPLLPVLSFGSKYSLWEVLGSGLFYKCVVLLGKMGISLLTAAFQWVPLDSRCTMGRPVFPGRWLTSQ